MHTWRKRLCRALLFLLCGLASFSAAAEIADVHTAINLAGRQRMLSQRVAKAYLQIGQGIDPAGSRRALRNSRERFEALLATLKRYAPTPEIRETYLELEKVWAAYDHVLEAGPPTREGAARILRLADTALALTHRATVQLETLSATPTGRVLNLAGRQRMLSQRLALLFHAQTWGLTDASAEMASARAEFDAALLELKAISAHTGTLKAELDLVGRQWAFFDKALTHEEIDRATRGIYVATASERILEAMEVAVSLYEPHP